MRLIAFRLPFAATILLSLAAGASAGPVLPAFPGAEGFGAAATGGCRLSSEPLRVVRVTTLADSGPGSFRDAVSEGGRVVMFNVGGYIHIGKRIHLPDNLTIAGETAPGDGICFKDEEIDLTQTHNVIIRHIKFRQGTDFGHPHQYSVNAAGTNIILDHCSIEWGRWDCIGLTGGRDITFQKCIIGEGLDPQRFGALVYSDNITFKSCLWINNHGRNPKACGKVQLINNVVYNWQVGGVDLGHASEPKWHEFVGNYYISGPVSSKRDCYYGINDQCMTYAVGNLFDNSRDGVLNGSPVEPEGAHLLKSPWAQPAVPVTAVSARQAYKEIVSDVGAFPTHRDALDRRLIDDLQSLGKEGTLKNLVKDAGGWPPLAPGTPIRDSNSNGLPDVWQSAMRGDPAGAEPAAVSHSGYTQLERYLHFLAGPHAFAKAHTESQPVDPVRIDLQPLASGYKAPVRYTVTTGASHGSATLESSRTDPGELPPHTLTYTPSPGFSGLDSLSITGVDADGDTFTRNISVLVSTNTSAE